MDAVIELKGLTKKYNDHSVVNKLDLTIQRGEVFGLLGPNGAGKTTTILMMLGLTERTEGEVSVLGYDPNFHAISIKSKVGYMPDDVGFYEDRTAIDNLMYTAKLNGIDKHRAKELAEQMLVRVGLEDSMYKKVGAFSRGMRQRLGLADVLIKKPEIIILDEPTLGIDPKGVRELLQFISELSKEEGITVLLSSHHLQQVQQVCDRVGLFVKGELIACGNINELSRTLSEKEAVIIKLEVSTPSNDLLKALNDNENIVSLDRQPMDNRERITLYCNNDITDQVARLVTKHGELYMLTRQDYGLDDIYHRYFAGGESSEATVH